MLLALPFASGQRKATQNTRSSDAEQAVRKLEREWLDAYTKRDVAAMERIVADDFTITYEGGGVVNKAQTIAYLKSDVPRNPALVSFTEDVNVRVYGDAAVVTGRYVAKGQENDKAFIRQSRYTDTYIKGQGR